MIDGWVWGEKLPRLSGRRVDLRWLTAEDAPALLQVFGDVEVMRFWSSPPLEDLAAASSLVDEIHRHFRARRLFQWGICFRETDTVVGTCTLHHVEPAHRRAEVGFALARTAWGQGLATEALELLIRFSFDALGLHRLEADADPDNERSIRTLERQGFKREGYLRERWHHLGELRDTVFLGLLRPEWTGKGTS
ncbi:MAG TPA: GNAT family N-acetyltransferase [Vicinamibacterales bacterium]|nr:GNAT family N-acetyltransferase [Vicinamibacterales bacterium]